MNCGYKEDNFCNLYYKICTMDCIMGAIFIPPDAEEEEEIKRIEDEHYAKMLEFD